MTDLPTLIVDSDTEEDMYACDMGEYTWTVRIDGPLPTVWDVVQASDGDNSIVSRPLRPGDRVTLATCSLCNDWRNVMGGRLDHGEHSDSETEATVPFATATVEKIVRTVHVSGKNRYFVTVTDVEAL